ncbi:MAG: nucleotidyltransferase family protein, partial [Oscillospiraceae bacterium]|nr:nucleotidyltransferase family protein [Oscillospiraceae bacterium]
MQVFGVVAECNPLHTGHELLLAEAKRRGADAVVAVMSGSFVQRGEPAVLSKFDRAADMARAGYDLVLELPVRFALSSAQRFAEGGVSALARTGIVDTLFFGSECGDMQLLQKAAAATEDAAVAAVIKAYTEQGQSYPAAQQKAVNEAYGETAASVFGGANNILAAEYLKANSRLQTGLAAQTMLRAPAAPSAQGIRRDAAAGLPLGGRVRAHTAKLLAGGGAIDQDLWQRVAMHKLRELPADAFASLADAAGGLAERMADAAKHCSTLSEFCEAVKTRRYTMSRVKRMACCAALGLFGVPELPLPYLRVLAIGPRGRQLLAQMKQRCSVPFSESLLKLSQ